MYIYIYIIVYVQLTSYVYMILHYITLLIIT